MSTTMEDAIRRNFADRATDRPNAIESANLRQRASTLACLKRRAC